MTNKQDTTANIKFKPPTGAPQRKSQHSTRYAEIIESLGATRKTKIIKVMMRNIFTILAIFCMTTAVSGEAKTTKKVRIALLGTMHFTPSTQDAYKNQAVDLSSDKRKKEIEEVISKLVTFIPNQICVELPVSSQSRTDSTYNQFLKGDYKLAQDEIGQLGFRSAQKLKIKGVTCVNYKGKFDTDPVTKFAQENNQAQILSGMDEYAKGFLSEIDQKQKSLSLNDFLSFANSSYALNKI